MMCGFDSTVTSELRGGWVGGGGGGVQLLPSALTAVTDSGASSSRQRHNLERKIRRGDQLRHQQCCAYVATRTTSAVLDKYKIYCI